VRAWLVDVAGLDPAAVRVKPNGVAGPAGPVPPPAGSRSVRVPGAAGAAKGVGLLLDAWRRADLDAELHIVGGGDLAGEVVRRGRGRSPHHLDRTVGAEAVASTWPGPGRWSCPLCGDEPFGRVAPEAFGYGRPVITTGLGGLGETVDATTGWVTGPEPADLAAALAEAAGDDGDVTARGALPARAGRLVTVRR
jgi:glycosyltransferase involved in cell wall biosynthesis